MKKTNLILVLLVLVFLIGCTAQTSNTGSSATDTGSQTNNNQQSAKSGNPTIKVDCNILTKEDILANADITKLVREGESEKYIVDYACQRIWNIKETGKTTGSSIALRVTDYSQSSVDLGYKAGDPCKGKTSLGIGDISCSIAGDATFARGDYQISVSFSPRNPDKAKVLAKVINDKIESIDAEDLKLRQLYYYHIGDYNKVEY